MSRRPAIIAAGLAAAALLVPGAGAETKAEQRVLVLLATWGPQPWSVDEIRRTVFDEADAFLRRSSFGQVSLRGDVTQWLAAYPQRPACPAPEHERVPPPLSDPPLNAARSAGYSPESYDRVVYVVPRTQCEWNAVGVNRDVFLNGTMSAWVVVHELGHTYGLAHARGTRCENGRCRRDEYGDPFSPMGHGLVDFSAYEKVTMGWIREVVRAERSGSYRVGRPDVLASAPHALVVPSGSGEYWLEQRLDVEPAGLAVRVIEPDVPDDDLAPPTRFVHDPARTGRDLVGAGELFAIPGAFSVRYVPAAEGRAELEFTWTDRTRPATPRLLAPGRRVRAGRPLRVAWATPHDGGSGVSFCTLAVDGRVVARIETERSAVLAPLKPGAHRLGLTCVDRAGNRSRTTVRRLQAIRG